MAEKYISVNNLPEMYLYLFTENESYENDDYNKKINTILEISIKLELLHHILNIDNDDIFKNREYIKKNYPMIKYMKKDMLSITLDDVRYNEDKDDNYLKVIVGDNMLGVYGYIDDEYFVSKKYPTSKNKDYMFAYLKIEDMYFKLDVGKYDPFNVDDIIGKLHVLISSNTLLYFSYRNIKDKKDQEKTLDNDGNKIMNRIDYGIEFIEYTLNENNDIRNIIANSISYDLRNSPFIDMIKKCIRYFYTKLSEYNNYYIDKYSICIMNIHNMDTDNDSYISNDDIVYIAFFGVIDENTNDVEYVSNIPTIVAELLTDINLQMGKLYKDVLSLDEDYIISAIECCPYFSLKDNGNVITSYRLKDLDYDYNETENTDSNIESNVDNENDDEDSESDVRKIISSLLQSIISNNDDPETSTAEVYVVNKDGSAISKISSSNKTNNNLSSSNDSVDDMDDIEESEDLYSISRFFKYYKNHTGNDPIKNNIVRLDALGLFWKSAIYRSCNIDFLKESTRYTIKELIKSLKDFTSNRFRSNIKDNSIIDDIDVHPGMKIFMILDFKYSGEYVLSMIIYYSNEDGKFNIRTFNPTTCSGINLVEHTMNTRETAYMKNNNNIISFNSKFGKFFIKYDPNELLDVNTKNIKLTAKNNYTTSNVDDIILIFLNSFINYLDFMLIDKNNNKFKYLSDYENTIDAHILEENDFESICSFIEGLVSANILGIMDLDFIINSISDYESNKNKTNNENKQCVCETNINIFDDNVAEKVLYLPNTESYMKIGESVKRNPKIINLQFGINDIIFQSKNIMRSDKYNKSTFIIRSSGNINKDMRTLSDLEKICKFVKYEFFK